MMGDSLPRKLSLSVLSAYALPGLPLAVATLPVYVFIPTLYAQEFGIGLAVIGTILFATRLFDAFSDPVIGFLSDHTNSRFGRRKPWVVLSMPLMVLSIYKLFVPPDTVDDTYLAIWSVVLTLSWTGILLPYSAWAAELSSDYQERTRLTSAREAMVLIGTMIAAALPTLLIAWGYPSLRTHAFGIALFVVAVLPVAVLICAKVVPDLKRGAQNSLGLREGLRVLVENSAFRRLLISYLINATANGLPATLFILFVSYRLDMPNSYGPLLFAYFLSGFAGIPIWYQVSKRISKHRTWCLAMVIAVASFVWTPFIVGPGDYYVFLTITIVSGLAVGADLVLPPSVQADVVDMDTLESGQQRTGLYFALWGMATKLALGLAAGLAFPLLQAAGFDAEAAKKGVENTESSLFALAMIYAFLPVIFKSIAIGLMWNFPLSRTDHAEVQAKLLQRKSEA